MKYKVIIIGAGVGGMTAALYLKRAGISCCIIEKNAPGGQLNYTSVIENYPGSKNITGTDLAYNIYNQLNELEIPFIFEEVTSVKKVKNKNVIITSKQQLTSEFVIIATGRSPKKLEIKNEQNLIGKGISYCAICDGPLYKNKEVIVIGGGDSAIKESLYLSNICKKVTILLRKSNFRGKESTINLEQKENIQIKYNTQVKEFIGTDHLTKVILQDDQELSCDGCFIFIGYHPETKIFSSIKITNKDGYIPTNELCQTKIENIFAIGDVREKNIFQIITSMNDGIIAASTIIDKIN